MIPTGTLEDDGQTLALTRRFAAPIDDVWACLTESDRLGRWFGTFTGDPSTGWVMVTINAEAEPMAPSRYDIVACEPPNLLAVRAVDDAGAWSLRTTLEELDGVTTLAFRHERINADEIGAVAVGWEWYLDRLHAAVLGGTPPSLDDFESAYMPAMETYAATLR